ncbi:hypothetical protein [Bradyrhizobium sp. NC92]|uniref:hypothetical protein n=1 Tax=Bradyrhizobium sp. (strain NC92) TaxID=55395 RepID=UPI0021AAA21F|nr:hypothetical protein [Bradyrhizobium sp. NC92]UWU68208.1 hypothetical protein N2602_34790 [Bradyrhizobium sp. NC92]
MDDKVKRTLKAFEALSDAEKADFLEVLKGFETRGRLHESIRKDLKISMGPLPGACPYCGRS